MLGVWSDDFGAAGEPAALQCLTWVLTENFESKELGTTGPNKCCCVMLLNRIIECSGTPT